MYISLAEFLMQIDKLLLIWIHNDSDSRLLDLIMPVLRNPFTWIPLYLAIAVYVYRKANYSFFLFVFSSLLVFALCDSISAQLLKPLFQRVRPCYNSELQLYIRNLIQCGGLYSLPSTHAANHFGLAFFWYNSISHTTGKKWQWLFIWAAFIGYAQVYVAKHYPSDIVAGALTGIIIAWPVLLLYKFILLEKYSFTGASIKRANSL
jgi:undecaprenyl-diphosphatase